MKESKPTIPVDASAHRLRPITRAFENDSQTVTRCRCLSQSHGSLRMTPSFRNYRVQEATPIKTVSSRARCLQDLAGLDGTITHEMAMAGDEQPKSAELRVRRRKPMPFGWGSITGMADRWISCCPTAKAGLGESHSASQSRRRRSLVSLVIETEECAAEKFSRDATGGIQDYDRRTRLSRAEASGMQSRTRRFTRRTGH